MALENPFLLNYGTFEMLRIVQNEFGKQMFSKSFRIILSASLVALIRTGD